MPVSSATTDLGDSAGPDTLGLIDESVGVGLDVLGGIYGAVTGRPLPTVATGAGLTTHATAASTAKGSNLVPLLLLGVVLWLVLRKR